MNKLKIDIDIDLLSVPDSLSAGEYEPINDVMKYGEYGDAVKGKSQDYILGPRIVFKKKRFRAKFGGIYYHILIHTGSAAVSTSNERNDAADNLRYDRGDYFEHKEIALSVADEINKVFKSAK